MVDLASLNFEVDTLDIDKLEPVPVDLSKLCDVVKMILKKMNIMARSKVSKIKHLILLTT